MQQNRPDEKIRFLPHHGMVNPNKPDKLRVVFDVSAQYKGTSLNDALLKGIDLLNSLFGVPPKEQQSLQFL